MNFQQMMKQAQDMQLKIQQMQQKLMDVEVQGESGGGMVKVIMTCSGKLNRITIDSSLMNGDKETLEDLIVAAVNKATEAKDERIKSETKSMMESLGLPGDMNIPF
ncbi:MAG: YbaB/EbfC family nucleoid-associated protein [Alphaproteobacteria bacterium]|nr:YbaB/EbfC family nucleoid-associated protein [Alphaproteobacteria bacterium]MBP7758666.1 YbaB/EbfC family nucleoid-associated protein [Alphaproteobacteria bacterium]MBP7761694.1 YbaB/EbfC family nucleoid-associated protein [Alphaproteobacteria bacterium]MBP7903971.1 YbaB/EbfC family nucleoid-associated protein [Alphaproteobacteria bacterium]